MTNTGVGFLGTVTVIGGGVAGLTAAQSLAQRGFKVYVVESRRGLGPTPESSELRLGGMASSQYSEASRVHKFSPDVPDLPGGTRLPGEHGFRFFPAYYHNVWDTMQEIPIYREGKPSGATVYDNLVPCLAEASVGVSLRPMILPQLRPRTFVEMFDELQQLRSEGITPSDFQAFLSRILRYMCTSVDRRAADCEDISFLQYLEGWNSVTSHTPVVYSERFINQVQNMPKVLAAFDASYGDARTEADTTVQMMRNLLVDQPKVDAVLNGPTTEAWFLPWRSHLHKLAVEFCEARLDRFYLDEAGALQASLSGIQSRGTSQAIATSDYFVLATDVIAAEAVTRDLPGIGVPGGLTGYATSVPPDPFTGQGAVADRNPLAEAGRVEWDRLQVGTGIQFFFRERVQVVSGHVYFGDSPWGLTSIMEQSYWLDPPTLVRDGFQSVLSVDIFEWYRPGLDQHPPAAESTRHEIAREVWRQLKVGVHKSKSVEVPEPGWYTMDHNILFARYPGDPEGSVDGEGPPVRDLTPYLVPVTKDWARRPGAEPWDPTSGGRAARFQPMSEGLWQAGHGGYLVHWDKLVFAGVYKKTFTRMTTMESACESGRHAVNAIMDHSLFARSGGTDTRDQPGTVWDVPTGFTTRRHGSPVQQPTQIGDYCSIWNIERHEVPELKPVKELDGWLFRQGLPHVWEFLGWDRLTSLASVLGHLQRLGDLPSLGSLLNGGVAGGGLDPVGVLPFLQGLRERLEALTRTRGGI